MYECVRLNFSPQPDVLAQAFLLLVPDKIYAEIKHNVPSYTTIVLGAHLDGKPIGILAASYNHVLKFADILHLYVEEGHRSQHVGRNLLALLEKEVKTGTTLTLLYPENQSETIPIEKMLAANKWQGSRPYVIRCFFDPYTFGAPWAKKLCRYPKGIEEFFWKDLKPEERADLVYRGDQKQFTRTLSPFREESLIEPLNSLGLRLNGRVVGWMITHRIDPETIRYSAFYIEHSLRKSGAAIPLLASAIRRHMASPTPKAVMDVPLDQTESSWIKLITTRLAPYATEVVNIRQAWKTTA